LEQALERGESSPGAAVAAAAAAARPFGLAAARADDRASAAALLGALAAEDAARIRRLLRGSPLLSVLAGIRPAGAGADRAGTGSGAAARGPGGLADPAAAFEALQRAVERGASSSRAAVASAAAAARLFGLAAARADDRDSAAALLAALAAEDPARLRGVLRASAAPHGEATAALLAACDPDEAADLILPPHLATAVAGLIRIGGFDLREREALLAAAAALPPSAPAALALADLAGLLAARRRLSAGALLARLRAEALAAGGEDGRTLAALLDEAAEPASRARTAAVRRELALETLRALLDGRLVGPPGQRSEAALAALSDAGAEAIRREIAPEGLRPRAAAAALSRLSPRALLRLVALLAPGGSARDAVRAALAETGGDRARLAALAAWLIAGGPAPPPPPRPAVEAPGPAAPPPASGRPGRGRSERALFFLLRTDPVAAAGRAGGTGADSADLALLFGRLPEADRREAEAMARRLSGPAARRAFDAGRLLASLGAAVRQALARRGGDSFAELWRTALAAAASPGERHALDRLLPSPPGRRGEALRPLPSAPEPGSAAWLLELLDAPADEARRGLGLLRSASFRRRLSRRLPRHLLARLLFAARPREARALLASADLIRGAFAAEGRSLAPEALWEALLDSLRAPPGAALGRLVERLLPEGTGEAAGLAPALLARARAARHGPLAAALEPHATAAAAGRRRKAAPAGEARAASASDRPASDRREEMSIFVRNAGLVIAAPFLGPLCERAGLTAPSADGAVRWIEPEAPGRAVHLLQYLADGRTDAPEPALALNKILCGLDPSWPSLPAIEMTPLERETCDSLLASILALWPALSGSSVAALRETFLQREGRLSRADPGWKLEVERKTLDVLLDTLPWSFATILTPWAVHPLSVTW
ncbi:MAG TPA: contractile injection system tape measure protein, partial [Allosphingosinicella sp.]